MTLGCETGVSAACTSFIDATIKPGRLSKLLEEEIYAYME